MLIPIPQIATCGAFGCARISTSTPAISFAATQMSFGGLAVTASATFLAIVYAMASVARGDSRRESPMSIFGRNKIEKQSP